MRKIMCYIDMLGRGGAQRVMSNLVTHFHSIGNQVILVNNYIRDDSLPHYEIPAAVKRFYLLKKRTGIPGIKHFKRIIALRKILKEEKPDLILSFLGSPNIITLIAAIGLKTKVVVSVRNDPNKEYGSSWIKKCITKILFRRSNGCVFQTNDASLYFSKKIREKSKIIFNPVAYNFFDTERAEQTNNIVTFGRFEPQKNHKMLIDAYSMLSDEYKKDSLIIYGDGPLKEETIEYCKSKGLEEKVLFPGNVSDVDEQLSKAKIFVLSSDYEGLPNALMEAMAVGVPCISTDCPCGGPRSLIEDPSQGILVPCKDAIALKDAIIKLLDDNELRENMSHCVKERSQAFRPDVIYSEWDNYIDKIIEK